MSTVYSDIQNIIQTWEGHPYDACMEIVKLLADVNNEPWQGIKTILSIPIRIGNNKADLNCITQDDLERYTYRYQNYISKLVEALAMKDDNEDIFYAEIKLVPYYQTNNALNLKEDEYKDIFDTIRPQINMAFHMSARKFDTKSEKTSQYWEIASTLSKREEQIVFWSVVMDMEKSNMKSNDD